MQKTKRWNEDRGKDTIMASRELYTTIHYKTEHA